MAETIALPGAPTWALPALNHVLPESVVATYCHRVTKPEGSIDAMRALAVTPTALLDIEMVNVEDEQHFETHQKTSVRTIPLRRVVGVSHLLDFAPGDDQAKRDTLAASLQITVSDPDETISLPFQDDDFGQGQRRARIDAVKTVGFALTSVLAGSTGEDLGVST